MPKKLTINNLKKCFHEASYQGKKYVSVLVQMEGFPKPEVIINENANFDTKFAYYEKVYDENLVLKSFSGVKIIGFTHGDSFPSLAEDLM